MKSLLIKSENSLGTVFEYLKERNSYEPIFERLRRNTPSENTKNYLFAEKDEEVRDHWIRGLSRSDIEAILIDLPQIFELYTEAQIIPLIRIRYRRYVFRIVYILWQDYYDKPKFRNLFLYIVNHPRSVQYATETCFTIEQLRAIALSAHVDRRLIELGRAEDRAMPEFFSHHRIRRDSVLAIDTASILFLFCSAQDYLRFGGERLLIAMMRLDTINQAKVLNNMVRKLTKEQRKELKEVFLYLLYTYYNKGKGLKASFWDYVLPEVKETVLDEFMS